jgi:uncharacterized membrane protein
MSEVESNKDTNRGCLKALAAGCGLVTLLVIISITLVYINWDSISGLSFFDQIKQANLRMSTELVYMEHLHEGLIDLYPSRNIDIRIRSNHHRVLKQLFWD